MWDYILGLGEANVFFFWMTYKYIWLCDCVIIISLNTNIFHLNDSVALHMATFLGRILCLIIADLCCKKRFLMKS